MISVPRRNTPRLFFTIALIALITLAGLYILAAGPLSDAAASAGAIFGRGGVESSMAISVVDDSGNTIATFSPDGKLAIIASSGDYNQDITLWLNSLTNYYFKFSPQVKPTFTADGTAKIEYEFKWLSVQYPAETNTAYSKVYKLAHVAQAQSPLTLPYTATFTDAAPKSGQALVISDPNCVVLAKINGMPTPEVGKSYTLKATLQVTAKLYVNNELASTATRTTECTITITNKVAGQLSALDITIGVGSAYAMW